MKDIIVGLAAVIGLVFGIIILAAIFGLFSYGMGWATGWLMHLVVGPDLVWGIPFEQFVAFMGLFSTMIGGTLAGVINGLGKKIDDKFKNVMKEYRGY